MPVGAAAVLRRAAASGLERCRLQNGGLASLRAREPARVSVLGAVPLQDPELAATELHALMDSGEFAGVEITASVNGSYLGDPRFEPFWAAAEECDALVFVHPTTRGFAAPAFAEHYLWNLVGNPMETTLTAAHLVLSGTMARHRRPAGAAGARRGLDRRPGRAPAPRPEPHRGRRAAARRAGQAADAVIRRFLFDTVTHDPRLLADLVGHVGADRVLLGSDYPFDMADPDPVAHRPRGRAQRRGRAAVLAGNAARELRPRPPREGRRARRPR